MKLLDRNWIEFARRIPAWRSVSAASRLQFLELKSNQSGDRSAFGADLAKLIEAKFVRDSGASARISLHPEASSFAKAVRAFARVPVLRRPTREALLAYMAEHFSSAERIGLLGERGHPWQPVDERLAQAVESRERLREFLDCADPRGWERRRLRPENVFISAPEPPAFESDEACAAARAIVRLAMESPAPIPFDELPRRLEGVKPRDWEAGLHACLRLALVFGGLDEEALPALWIWPPLARRLQRPPAVAPGVVEAARSYAGLPRLDDLTAMLIALSAEPARLKADARELFARDEQRLADAFAELPEWIAPVSESELLAVPQRLDAAVNLSLMRRWVERARVDGHGVLRVTDAGRAWLALRERERVAALIDPARITGDALEQAQRSRLAESVGSYSFLEFLFPEYGRPRREQKPSPVLAAFVCAWRELAGAGFVDFGAWLDHATRVHNPLADLPDVEQAFAVMPWELRTATEDQRERIWQRVLVLAFEDWMWPLGGVELGRAADDRPCIRLTPIGRYMIGAAPRIVREERQPARAEIVVQPTFEVVFLAHSVAAEAAIARFCTRRGRGVGTLFEITRESCLLAAATGLDVDRALAELAAASSKPVPQNVEHEMRVWFGEARRLSLEHVALVRCPDAATAARLRAAGGAMLRAVSDTVVELVDKRERAKLVRKLREHGLFIDLPDSEPATRRSARRSSRW